jgi:pimeloyl-ACP methyl ester carboxylesterase
MNNMHPVTFRNKDGFILFGILHGKEKSKINKTAIVILSPGIKSRIAPHRLYIKMARKFENLNFPVLRFDFYGLGDSEGEIEEKYTANLYGSIQVGRYVNDTITAMDWMESEYGIKKFILVGLCGGAITGLLTQDDRVQGLISLGIPVILDSSEALHQKYITNGELMSLRDRYIKKLFNPNAWIRFLTFQSDYMIFLKSILLPWTNNKSKKGQPKSNTIKDNTNPYFADNFFKFAGGKKMLNIFSEADRLYWEYDEKFINRYPDRIKHLSNNVETHVVKNANHIFSFKEWQNNMLQLSEDWILKYFKNI